MKYKRMQVHSFSLLFTVITVSANNLRIRCKFTWVEVQSLLVTRSADPVHLESILRWISLRRCLFPGTAAGFHCRWWRLRHRLLRPLAMLPEVAFVSSSETTFRASQGMWSTCRRCTSPCQSECRAEPRKWRIHLSSLSEIESTAPAVPDDVVKQRRRRSLWSPEMQLWRGGWPTQHMHGTDRVLIDQACPVTQSASEHPVQHWGTLSSGRRLVYDSQCGEDICPPDAVL